MDVAALPVQPRLGETRPRTRGLLSREVSTTWLIVAQSVRAGPLCVDVVVGARRDLQWQLAPRAFGAVPPTWNRGCAGAGSVEMINPLLSCRVHWGPLYTGLATPCPHAPMSGCLGHWASCAIKAHTEPAAPVAQTKPPSVCIVIRHTHVPPHRPVSFRPHTFFRAFPPPSLSRWRSCLGSRACP